MEYLDNKLILKVGIATAIIGSGLWLVCNKVSSYFDPCDHKIYKLENGVQIIEDYNCNKNTKHIDLK